MAAGQSHRGEASSRHPVPPANPAPPACAPWSLLLLLLLLLSLSNGWAVAEPPPQAPLTIAYPPDNAPLSFTADNDDARGLLIDLWRAWADGEKREIRFIPASPGEGLEMLSSGDADILTDGLLAPPADPRFALSSPLVETRYFIFHHRTIFGLKDLEDLQGFRIGIASPDTRAFLESRLPDAAIVAFDSYAELLEAASAGKLKVVLASPYHYHHQLATNPALANLRYNPSQPLLKRDYQAITLRQREALRARIDAGLAALDAATRGIIEARWLKSPKPDKDPHALTVLLDQSAPPYSMYDNEGRAAGILVDFWRKWASEQQHKIQFRLIERELLIPELYRHNGDFIGGRLGLEQGPSPLENSAALFSVPISLYVASNDTISPTEWPQGKIGYHDNLLYPVLSKHLPAEQLILYPDLSALIAAFEAGHIDSFASDRWSADYHLLRSGTAGRFRIHPRLSLTTPLHAGVMRDDRWRLANLEEGLEKLPEGLVADLAGRWGITPPKRAAAPLNLNLLERKWLAAHPVIPIGVDGRWPPICHIDEEGNHQGLTADYLSEIGKLLGIRFVARQEADFEQMLDAAAKGRYKAAIPVARTEERAKRLLFSDPFYHIHTTLIARKDGAMPQSFEDLHGKLLAVEKGYASVHLLRSQHPEIRLLELPTTLDALKAVSLGKADAYFGTNIVAQWLIEREQLANLTFAGDPGVVPAPLRIAVHKAPGWSPLPRLINKALSAIPDARHRALRGRWLPISPPSNETTTFELSPNERQWLDEHPSILLGVNPSQPPIEFIDEHGVYRGLSSEYIEELSKMLGIRMTPMPGLTWSETFTSIETRDIDLLPATTITPERNRYMRFTDPYLRFPLVIFVREQTMIASLEDLNDKRVAVERGYAVVDALRRDYPEIHLDLINDGREGLVAVSNGVIEAYIGNLAVGLHLIDRDGLHNLKIGAPTPYHLDLRLAVRRDWPELAELLNRALNSLSEQKKTDIRQRWLKIRYDAGADYTLVWQVAGISLVILSMFIAWLALMRRQKQALAAARDSAEQANRFKSYFLANMSHEIRTPMNAVVGYSHLLADTRLDSRQQDYLKRIRSAAHNLLSLINDILDFSRIEAGKLDIETTEFHLDELLESLSYLFARRAHEKGLELIFRRDPNIPETLIGDPLRLEQILANLLGNAIKFTESGMVRLEIVPIRADDARLLLRFSVMDSGIGIAPEKLDTLFSPFTQGDGSTTRKFGGSGLGLSIVKHLVDLMGGEIRVESIPGEGSRFLVHLPIRREPPAAERFPDALNGSRILVVDDHPDRRPIFEEIFARYQMQPTFSDSKAHTRELLKEGGYWDLALVSRRLSHGDGLSLAHQLRRECPVIVTMTTLEKEQLPHRTERGCAELVLTHPIYPGKLRDAMLRVLVRQSDNTAEYHEHPPALLSGHVLLVEDNPDNQRMAKELLTRSGLRVSTAENGLQAVEMIADRPFDLVLMDIQMPRMDGFQATALIHAMSGREKMPILAMTAHAAKEDRRRSLAAGMLDHITKPIDPEVLHQTLARFLPAAPESPRIPVQKSPPPLFDENPPEIDHRNGLRRVGHNRELYLDLLRTFIANHHETARGIAEAIAKQRYPEARHITHTLRGIAGNIGASPLAAAAARLDYALQRQQYDGLLPIVDGIADQLEHTVIVISRLLEHYPAEDTHPASAASGDYTALLNDIRELLEEGDAAVTEYLLELTHRIPEALPNKQELVRRLSSEIAEFEFDAAINTLQLLRIGLETMDQEAEGEVEQGA